ncbi:hypothetical protein HPB48_016576 [Haemaphysalis longicornis]|uniref:Monocarboxylate transporter n=1 Tax=Haemaphysalis longicornis TaxID=44386 RepID=A0A9J6FF96_HAELO|nr:hypothetical protein HPB48_016576 [Haemaphysalis longicornis]
MDKGWGVEDATSLMMCISVGSLVGRLLLPLLADFKFLTRSALMSACYVAVAAVFLAMPHVDSFHGLIMLCVVSGATVGCALTLKPVLIADYLGADQIAPTMGVTGIIMLPLIIGNPAIVGKTTRSIYIVIIFHCGRGGSKVKKCVLRITILD